MAAPQTTTDSHIWKALDTAARDLVEPHRYSPDRPPFSARELIILALLQHPEGLTAAVIVAEILFSSPWYGSKALEEYSKGVTGTRHGSYPRPGIYPGLHAYAPTVSEVIDGFEEALAAYDMPLTNELVNDEITYFAEPRGSRILLNKYLAPRSPAPFRLLDLAPELRNEIYEFVFSSGDAGHLLVMAYTWRDNSKECRFETVRRENGSTMPLTQQNGALRSGQDRYYFQTPSVSTIRALTQTSKEIHGESAAVFFNLNAFRFDAFSSFVPVILKIPSNFVLHLSHVEIRPDGHGTLQKVTAQIPEAFKALSIATKLSVFKMQTSDDEWLGMRPAAREAMGRKTKFREYKQIPGMEDLVKIAFHAKVFELIGECPDLQSYVEEGVNQLKEEGNVQPEDDAEIQEPTKSGRKRKSKGGTQTQKAGKLRSKTSSAK